MQTVAQNVRSRLCNTYILYYCAQHNTSTILQYKQFILIKLIRYQCSSRLTASTTTSLCDRNAGIVADYIACIQYTEGENQEQYIYIYLMFVNNTIAMGSAIIILLTDILCTKYSIKTIPYHTVSKNLLTDSLPEQESQF